MRRRRRRRRRVFLRTMELIRGNTFTTHL